MIQNIPIERLKTVVELADEKGVDEASRILGVTAGTIKRYRNEIKNRNKVGANLKVTQKVQQKDTIDATMVSSNQFTTEEQMAEFCDIDRNIWEASSIVTNQWGSEENPSWQFKVRWSRIKGLTPEMVLETLQESLKKFAPRKMPMYKKVDGDVMLEVSIPDIHIGRAASVAETGNEYNVEIAVDEWLRAHEYFYEQHKHLPVEKVVIASAGDFFNVDNNMNTTTKGTPQVEDGRWQRSFKAGCNAAVASIEFWRSKGIKVVFKIIPGNHDAQRAYYLGAYLEAWYKEATDVKIDNAPTLRKYEVYGINLIGWSHGDKDFKQLKHVYQSEMREYLSQCTNVEFHTGHVHQEKVVEEFGSVIIRTIPSLAQKSIWEVEAGYTGNRRAQAFVWHKTKGLLNINYYTPDYLG
ncbi:MAG: hypothetical protein EOM11_09065 [Erysipelotrichia bacterium]|nr:hypothetical protein [Erysipelotrichia bacterium]